MWKSTWLYKKLLNTHVAHVVSKLMNVCRFRLASCAEWKHSLSLSKKQTFIHIKAWNNMLNEKKKTEKLNEQNKIIQMTKPSRWFC